MNSSSVFFVFSCTIPKFPIFIIYIKYYVKIENALLCWAISKKKSK